MGVAVGLVIALVFAAIATGGILSPGIDSVEDAGKSGNENASSEVNNASCIADCKKKNPGDYGEFLDCRENNGCPE